MQTRTLGESGIHVSPVAMGCWPIAGMTSLDVNEADSLKTLNAAFDSGVNFFDTAYCYGATGESEKLIAKALGSQRESIVIATKGGIEWDASGQRVINGSANRLREQCEESLQRLGTDYVDLLYLHAPDPNTPLAESAGALGDLMRVGKTRSVGVSNVGLEQLKTFHETCPVTALQPPYNMLQRDIEQEIVPWCLENRVSIVNYWPLMKGLLAGKLARDHKFAAGDGRAKYPMFQGGEWERNQDLVDDLRIIAHKTNLTVAQLSVAWCIYQNGITSALCGAKRDFQITETGGAMTWKYDESVMQQVAEALKRRGKPVLKSAV